MSRTLRITLLLIFALLATLFAWQFKGGYERYLANRTSVVDSSLANPDPAAPSEAKAAPAPKSHLGWWGGGLVLSLLGVGLFAALEISQIIGDRAARAYYDDSQEGPADPEYETAEDEWNKGNYLEAVRLLRDYLNVNPRQLHAALRIAEIYEKDLLNPLAAALEYEEVLQHRLPPERWGWAAIHLCNLYTGKLHQPTKAIALLRRIETEFANTAAAEKARARLEQLVEQGVIEALPPPEPPQDAASPASPPPDPGPSLPPGFRPR